MRTKSPPLSGQPFFCYLFLDLYGERIGFSRVIGR